MMKREAGSTKLHDQSDLRQRQQPFWRRRRILLLIVAIVLIIAVAIGVGAGVGLSQSDDSDDEDDDDDSMAPSATPTSDRSEIWQPEVGSAWQIVLNQPLDIDLNKNTIEPDVAVFDIDLYSNPTETIDHLHELDRKVICYFSAGSYEDWRDDEGDFDEDDLGKGLDGWPGERWLKLDSDNVREIMTKRLDLAAEKGCDAVDPDNVDGYQNDNGLSLTEQDSIDYVTFLANEASKRGLAMGLKNAGSIIPDVLDLVQFSVNEQCELYNECDEFDAFIEDGKPVFHIEYPDDAPDVTVSDLRKVCPSGGRNAGGDGGEGRGDRDMEGDGKGGTLEGFSTVLKEMELNNWVRYCDGEVYEVPEEDDQEGG